MSAGSNPTWLVSSSEEEMQGGGPVASEEGSRSQKRGQRQEGPPQHQGSVALVTPAWGLSPPNGKAVMEAVQGHSHPGDWCRGCVRLGWVAGWVRWCVGDKTGDDYPRCYMTLIRKLPILYLKFTFN